MEKSEYVKTLKERKNLLERKLNCVKEYNDYQSCAQIISTLLEVEDRIVSITGGYDEL